MKRDLDQRWSDFTSITAFVSRVALQRIHADPRPLTMQDKNSTKSTHCVLNPRLFSFEFGPPAVKAANVWP